MDKNDNSIYFMKQHADGNVSDDMLNNFSTQVH